MSVPDLSGIACQGVVSSDPHTGTRKSLSTLLILFIDEQDFDDSQFSSYESPIQTACTSGAQHVHVYLVHPAFSCAKEEKVLLWPRVQVLSTFVYSICASSVADSTRVTVYFDGWYGANIYDRANWSSIYINSSCGSKFLPAERSFELIHPLVVNPPVSLAVDGTGKAYPVVTINGTFDHLHHGHRNHIALAAWLATETLICSISPDDERLVARKKNSAFLELFSVRCTAVENFLRSIKPLPKDKNTPTLHIACIPSSAKLGAQANEPVVHATVLSAESFRLGGEINALRAAQGLDVIDVLKVGVVGRNGYRPESNDHKISSSLIRKVISERRIDLILLNGPAGSGKLTIAQRLSGMIPGSRVIDNHLMSDLADAMCDRTNPGYMVLRTEIRRLVFDFITNNASAGTCFIFTSNYSVSEAGTQGAREFVKLVDKCGGRLFPIIISCSEEEMQRRVAHPDRASSSRLKLTNPSRAAELARDKTMYRFSTDLELELEVTQLSVDDAASIIAKHVGHT